MKKIFNLSNLLKSWLIITLLVFSFGFNYAQAQEPGSPNEGEIEEILIEEILLQAEAGSNKNVVIGRTVLFDASGSTGDREAELKYHWDFGDGYWAEGLDASHIYKHPGTYSAILTVSDGVNTSTDQVIVSVEKYLAILISDKSVGQKKIEEFKNYATTQDVLIVDVRDDSDDPGYLVTQKLANKLINKKEDIIQANLIITWTSSQAGLNALAQFATNFAVGQDETKLEDYGFAQKAIVTIADSKSSAVAKIAQDTFNVLRPLEIVITEEDNIKMLVEVGESDKLVSYLQNKQVGYQLIGVHSQRVLSDVTPLNFLSYLMSYLVNNGVSQDTLYLILALPIIATLIAFARQLIGFKAYGIYMPSMMTLIFLVTGVKYAVIIFFALLIMATLARLFAKKLRILYLPRMAIVLTAVSLTIIGVFVVSAMTGRTGFLAVSIFPLLIMTILTEKFVEVQIEKGAKQAFKLIIETLILSLASYYIVTWQAFETIILAYPELIFLTIIINYILGRFAGLRLMEYLRFRNVIAHVSTTKK